MGRLTQTGACGSEVQPRPGYSWGRPENGPWCEAHARVLVDGCLEMTACAHPLSP